jgi:DNA invertase Pin-like site-specific DNA recombinase
MNAIAYVRVSTVDQTQGLSFEAQERAISQEVARRGWTMHSLVTEARSGKSAANRPELQRALSTLAAGYADCLVVARLDRLARSLIDLLTLMDRAKQEGWTLLILSPTVDLSDPFGKCMAQVAGAFAELERELIGQRQRESVAARKAAGTYKKPPKRITDEAEERIAHLFGEGLSLRGIARQLELEGYAPPAGSVWHARSIGRIAQRASGGS